MEFPHPPDLHPAFLQPGTLVGPWRVVSRRGRGTYGVVYRAVREGQEQQGIVALKIAMTQLDSRFDREVELLSRIHHPSVPRPRDDGFWRSPQGALYPYIVMDWVEGMPLYEWAATHNPSSCRVARMLAQVASALAATHEAGGVHRDVKGDNTLVKQDGERVVLTDFGLGNHTGAATLTPYPIPPATPAYRSPEAWVFARRYGSHPRAHYTAQPTDDLFALGITAYRLVTEQYPPPTEPGLDGSEVWHVEGEVLKQPRELNPRVSQRLNALILKMLAVNPAERGTAQELAEALEHLSESKDPEDHVPLFGWETLEPSDWPTQDRDAPSNPDHRPLFRDMEKVHAAEHRASAARKTLDRIEVDGLRVALARTEQGSWREPSSGSGRTRWVWLTLVVAAVVMPLLLKAPRQESLSEEFLEAPMMVQAESLDGERDAGTVDLGDGVLASAATFETPMLYRWSVYSAEFPKGPLPGQRRAPCPGSVEIQGGCWMKHEASPPDCPDFAYEWRGSCFVPIFSKPRPSSSEP
ncbi:serine/threonine-protein kinase [Hyalangium versicolor]|uniref:serine/threonine-protein kinase n=1 Tax=Hyalangium versicolor TaxID=2861190 RepID=UPI001CCDAEA0|nr:serine/threonine-protein kinase [Hyalangium versicolor]